MPFHRDGYIQSWLSDSSLPEEFEMWLREWPLKAVIGWMWPGLLESSLTGKEGWWHPRTYNLLSEDCLVADISETPSSNCIVEKCRIFVERQRPDESGKRFNEQSDLQVFAML